LQAERRRKGSPWTRQQGKPCPGARRLERPRYVQRYLACRVRRLPSVSL